MSDEVTMKLLRVFVGEGDRWQGRPLHTEIVKQAMEAGLAGATVVRAVEGYGTHSRLHMASVLTLCQDLPMIVEIIDTEERVRAFLPVLDSMVVEGLIMMENVTVVKHVTRAAEPQPVG